MPSRSPLFVDKISLTLSLEDVGAIGRITESVLHQDRVGGFRFLPMPREGGYRHSKAIVFDNDCKVLVQYSPRRLSEASRQTDRRRRPLRLEWNPARLREAPEYQAAFLAILRGWFRDALAREMWRATITRIDFAADVRGVNLNRILVARSDTTVKSSLYLGREGQLESNYLGSKDSDLLYLLYDKRTERGGRVHGGGFERTRIEVRIREALRISELLSFENPFAKLTLREWRRLEICSNENSQHQWVWFFDSCKLRGLEAALNSIRDPRARRGWRRRVAEIESPEWWRPEEIWAGLPYAIEQIGIFERPSRIRRRSQ